jgi:hypothetical protein
MSRQERPTMPLTQQFAQDRQGRRFADVLNDTRISFPAILDFFDHPDRQRRLIESELHHDRPALAGVIRELEHRQDVDQFFRTNDGHVTTRFRQAVGVVVRIIMESHGWKTTGRKGSLGLRAKVPTRTPTAGAYHNTGGLAVWFTRAERYELVAGSPYRSVEERAAEIELTTATTEPE